jgi:TonB family protein
MMFGVFSGKSVPNPLTFCLAGSILIHVGILGFLFQSRSSFLLINQPTLENYPIELIPIVSHQAQNPENSGNGSGNNSGNDSGNNAPFEGDDFNAGLGQKNDRNGQDNAAQTVNQHSNSTPEERIENPYQNSHQDSINQSNPQSLNSEPFNSVERDTSSLLVLAANPSTDSLEDSIDNYSSVINSGINSGINSDSHSESRNLPASLKPGGSQPGGSQPGRSGHTGTGTSATGSGTGSGRGSATGSGQGHPSTPLAAPTPILTPTPIPTPEPPPENFACIACPPPPRYPHSAHLAAINGSVQVIIDVDRQGFVTAADLGTSSGSAELDNAAIVTVRNWQFTPTRAGRYGIPVYVDFELVP